MKRELADTGWNVQEKLKARVGALVIPHLIHSSEQLESRL